ncbi:MAG TPA: hypothetical protein VG142_13365 [Trebonia sp.]|nr:hypothetical protein [Trebonia sp.]
MSIEDAVATISTGDFLSGPPDSPDRTFAQGGRDTADECNMFSYPHRGIDAR